MSWQECLVCHRRKTGHHISSPFFNEHKALLQYVDEYSTQLFLCEQDYQDLTHERLGLNGACSATPESSDPIRKHKTKVVVQIKASILVDMLTCEQKAKRYDMCFFCTSTKRGYPLSESYHQRGCVYFARSPCVWEETMFVCQGCYSMISHSHSQVSRVCFATANFPMVDEQGQGEVSTNHFVP